MNDSEEKPLTLSELRALAEKLDLLNGLASKARDRTTQNKGKREEVSEQHLLSLGGTKVGAQIVFGPEGETQLIFEPPRFKQSSLWAVSLKGNISHHDTQRELNKAGRGLWDRERGKPAIAYQAAEQLLACYIEIECQFRRTLLLLLLRRLREKAKQDGETAEDTPFTYPKPEIDKLREQLAVVEEQLGTVSEQLATAQDAISLTVETLSKGLERKLQKAFDLLQGDQWPQDIQKLWDCARILAAKLQRPPTKAELRMHYKPNVTLKEKDFSPLLKHAGLSWLKKGPLKIPNFP